MDSSGYPDEQELRTIREWPEMDLPGLMEFICERWKYAEQGSFIVREGVYHLSTLGWSGNEEIIGALQQNRIFWSLCWQVARRGGHYEFILPIFPSVV